MRRTTLLGAILAFGLTLGLTTAWADGPASDADLAKAKVELARKTYEAALQAKLDADRVYRWSRRWMEAQAELSKKKTDQVAVYEAYLQRMKALRRLTEAQYQAGAASQADALASVFYVVEATLWLSRAKRK